MGGAADHWLNMKGGTVGDEWGGTLLLLWCVRLCKPAAGQHLHNFEGLDERADCTCFLDQDFERWVWQVAQLHKWMEVAHTHMPFRSK